MICRSIAVLLASAYLTGCMFNPAGPTLEQRAMTKAAELKEQAALEARNNSH